MHPMTELTISNLRKRGFSVAYFDTAAEAADYLDRSIDGKTVGVGGSVTLQEMGLYDKLSTHNRMFWHWYAPQNVPMLLRQRHCRHRRDPEYRRHRQPRCFHTVRPRKTLYRGR